MMYRSLMIAGLAATAALEGLGAMHEDPMSGGKGFAGGEFFTREGQEPTNINHTSEANINTTNINHTLRIKLGVLRLEGWGNPITTQTGVKAENATEDHPFTGYVPLPGDTDSNHSYNFDFIAEVADGCTFEALCDPTSFKNPKKVKALLPGVVTAIKKLVKRGAQAIIGNCGLFMWLHATGLIEHAVDKVMEDLGDDYIRPYAMLSSLTTLGSSLATLGVGEGQEKALARWTLPRTSRWKRWLVGKVTARKCIMPTSVTLPTRCKVVIFTSNGESCKALLKAIPQLKGLKVFFDGETEGDVLVVGLNGVVNNEKVPVIGLKGVSVKGQVGGESVNGFNAVATGQPVLYKIVQPDIMRVAKAVKKKYPTVRMAYVECTEVSAYSDTIREAMRVPVYDPIHTAYGMINAANNHNFSQLGNKDRIAQIALTLKMSVAELVEGGIVDEQLPELGASDHPLYAERQRAGAMQMQTAKLQKQSAALQASRKKLGDRHPRTLKKINNMGLLLKEMGQLEEAKQLYTEALEGKRDTLADPHDPSLLLQINNMGTLLEKMGEPEEARLLLGKVLQAARDDPRLGDRHPRTLVSINNMGQVLQAMGQLKEAKQLYEEAKQLYEEAKQLYEEALQAKRETLGDRNQSTLITIGNLADLLRATGDLVNAKAVLGNTVGIAQEVFGIDNMRTLKITAIAARLQHAQPGGAAAGKELLATTVARMAEVPGDNHQDTRKYRQALQEME